MAAGYQSREDGLLEIRSFDLSQPGLQRRQKVKTLQEILGADNAEDNGNDQGSQELARKA